jgi:hypothetical protein
MHQVVNDIKQPARARTLKGNKGNILGNVDATHAEVQRGRENKNYKIIK